MGGEAAALFMFSLEMRLHIKMFYFVTTTLSAMSVRVMGQKRGQIEDLEHTLFFFWFCFNTLV